MIHEPIEERLARLEEQVASLIGGRAGNGTAARDEWMQTVGMFQGDPAVKEMIDESLRSRDAERRQAQEQAERDSA